MPARCLYTAMPVGNGACGGCEKENTYVWGKAKCRPIHFNDGNKIKMIWFEWKWWCWKPNAGCSAWKSYMKWNWNGTIVVSGWSGRRFAIAFKDIQLKEGRHTAILFMWPCVIFLALQIVHQTHMNMDYSGVRVRDWLGGDLGERA